MRRWLASCTMSLVVCGTAALLIPTASAGSAPPRHRVVTVTPSVAPPSTTFRVSFRAPDRTGRVGSEYRYDSVSAAGPSGSGKCLSQVTRDAGASRAHARVRVKLAPGHQGWCLGAFHGTVSELERPACPVREICPLYVVLVKRIGPFAFRVER